MLCLLRAWGMLEPLGLLMQIASSHTISRGFIVSLNLYGCSAGLHSNIYWGVSRPAERNSKYRICANPSQCKVATGNQTQNQPNRKRPIPTCSSGYKSHPKSCRKHLESAKYDHQPPGNVPTRSVHYVFPSCPNSAKSKPLLQGHPQNIVSCRK